MVLMALMVLMVHLVYLVHLDAMASMDVTVWMDATEWMVYLDLWDPKENVAPKDLEEKEAHVENQVAKG